VKTEQFREAKARAISWSIGIFSHLQDNYAPSSGKNRESIAGKGRLRTRLELQSGIALSLKLLKSLEKFSCHHSIKNFRHLLFNFPQAPFKASLGKLQTRAGNRFGDTGE